MLKTSADQANKAIEDELRSNSTNSDWPQPPAAEAFTGLLGRLVDVISPHSEADPVSLLTNALIAFGNVIGRYPYFRAEADQHYTNINIVQVGKSSKARKGSSLGQILRLLTQIDEDWVKACVKNGLSSGEGLIWSVRDPIEKSTPIKEKGKPTQYETQVVDPGVSDKRLLVTETEFSSTLRVLRRENNTLSAVVRQAWDTGNLSSLTKNSPGVAHNAHISILGHITQQELLRYLDDTEVGNGFANRFLWVCVKRSKVLPEGGDLKPSALDPIRDQLRDAIVFARNVGEMKRDDNARKAWHDVYEELSEGKPGLVGSITARAEAQVMRLACIYALLDKSPIVRSEHLLAALALWDYCEASVRYIFANKLGDPVADAIMNALSGASLGLTRTELSEVFGRHQSAGKISDALAELQALGRVRCALEITGGRSGERWFAIQGVAK